LAIGFYPKPMLEAITPSAEKVLAGYPALVTEYAANGSLLPATAAGSQDLAIKEVAIADVVTATEPTSRTNEVNQTR
jgi:hypothetical protein